MPDDRIKDLFEKDVERKIEEVIKVDQADEDTIAQEISEYVATESICDSMHEVLDAYLESKRKPNEGVAIWISGFFGSGKSSFAKMLGLALEGRRIKGESATDLISERFSDPRISSLLGSVRDVAPTDAVIFDVSTDRGIRSGSQTLTEIMYKSLLGKLGYARDLDIAELEITLEQEGRLEKFRSTYAELYDKDWDAGKGLTAFAFQHASRVMHELDPDNYPRIESWRESAAERADISPNKLAGRCIELMERRRDGRGLIFVIDEVGQFISRDVQKMLDLQAIVQSIGKTGKGRIWIAVTSQEQLKEIVGNLDDTRVELARLRDRFPIEVHLAPSDITEVTSKRILEKRTDARERLLELFDESRGSLAAHAKLSVAGELPELEAESFADLYPMLPYQSELIISIVSGLRTQGGASRHVGGANRTIIKLAQQLLVHPSAGLMDEPVGKLVTLDRIYDLVDTNISSELQRKISEVEAKNLHPMAAPAIKAICLLQFVPSVHKTAENIAAALYPELSAPSMLSRVREALEALESAKLIKLGDDGYRIPTPAEDDWESTREALNPRTGDRRRIVSKAMQDLWSPQPKHTLEGVRAFKGGLVLYGRPQVDGDLPFKVQLADSGAELEELTNDARSRSREERGAVFWVAELDAAVGSQVIEVYRSDQMLSRKEGDARTQSETKLVAEERRRLKDGQRELRRLIQRSLLAGLMLFRGNDRGPDSSARNVSKAAGATLAKVLPEVYSRFGEGAAKVSKRDLEKLILAEGIEGLPKPIEDLELVEDRGRTRTFACDSEPLRGVLERIKERASYGQPSTGGSIKSHFAEEPFGWELDVTRLMVVCLIKAGKAEAKSQGSRITSSNLAEEKKAFVNNNIFRATSLFPREDAESLSEEERVHFSDRFGEAFGKQPPSIVNADSMASALKQELGEHEPEILKVREMGAQYRLPSLEPIREGGDLIREIAGSEPVAAIRTFIESYRQVKRTIALSSEIQRKLDDKALEDITEARSVRDDLARQLIKELPNDEAMAESVEALGECLSDSKIHERLPDIRRLSREIRQQWESVFDDLAAKRAQAYKDALEELRSLDGWRDLSDDERAELERPLAARAEKPEPDGISLASLRDQTGAARGLMERQRERALRAIEGDKVEIVELAKFFKGGIETPEQLERAIEGIREEVGRLIGQGKKVMLR